MSTLHKYVTEEYFPNNPGSHPANLYRELKDKYGVNILFEMRETDTEKASLKHLNIRGEVAYLEGHQWVVRLTGRGGPNFERVIMHELMHIALRYRQNLPYADPENITGIQVIILNALEDAIIGPLLNTMYSDRDEISWGEEYEKILKIVSPYLEEITRDITRDKYLEILAKCLRTCDQPMPKFLL